MKVRFRYRLAFAWCACAVTAVLAGCADRPETSASYRSPDARAFAESAMAIGPMLVEIQGRPYAEPPEQIDRAVLTDMSQALSWTASPRLTTDPAATKVPSMVVTMTFNGGVVDANAQCRGESTGGEPQPQGAVQVAASFCGSGAMISNTVGRIDASSGVDDPQFARLMAQVARDLFPPSYEQPQPGLGIGIGGGGGGFGVGTGGGVGIGIGIGRWRF
jgi:hypothetical protein